MAWPQAPQPAPAPPPAARSSLPLGPIITGAAGFLTFLFSFVQIVKVDNEFADTGWSVWTLGYPPGMFGVGTLIPLFALVAGAIALARGFGKGLDAKEVLGFSLLQLQMVAAFFAVVLWFGYLISTFASGSGDFELDFGPGLGLFLLFLGLAGVIAGTVFSLMDLKKGTSTGISTGPGGPPSGQWGTPGPQPDASGQWPQPAPPSGQWQPQPHQQPPPQQQPPPPPYDPAQWQQPAAPAPQPSWDPNPQPGPGQWQPDPAGQPAPPPPTWAAPPGPEQAWQPPPGAGDPGPVAPQPAPPGPVPEPGPLDPQPAPPSDPQPEPAPAPAAGGLFDPGTEVIPGPPPAPPPPDPNTPGTQGDEQGGLPPIPPSNTP